MIQEGEKKAEKACKHGILSLGIQGIYNIGTAQTGLFRELQYIVSACRVKNIVLLFDSDWNDLSRNLVSKDKVDSRPRQFAKAAAKFKAYIGSLHNEGLDVDVWFGHPNSRDEKGIDDLLTGSLAGRESDFLRDMEKAMHAVDGHSDLVDIIKISSKTDFQIHSYWHLNDFEEFYEHHREKLAPLDELIFSGVRYVRNEQGKMVLKSTTGSDLQFWNVEYSDKGKATVEFRRLDLIDFLSANGYRQVHSLDMKPGESSLCFLDDGIIYETSLQEARRFVLEHLRRECRMNTDIPEKFLSNIGKIMSNDVAGQIQAMDYAEYHSDPYCQLFPYLNGFVKVDASTVEPAPAGYVIWEDQVIRRNFDRMPIFSAVRYENGRIIIEKTKDGEECEFLQFLEKTSNFWHENPEAFDEGEYSRHFLNKITSIGYMLHSFKDDGNTKAIVAMDGKMSESDQSNGRTGKSLVSKAISRIAGTETVNGRRLTSNDDFVYNSVTSRTRVIVYDDIKMNFEFRELFNDLTSDMTVNIKGGKRFVLPFDRSPKIMLTTNYAINADDRSTNARRVLMSFSDYFNVERTPVTEFGHSFFQGWDERQWCLFDNLMLECIMIHLRAKEQEWDIAEGGIVTPPLQNLRRRQLRQQMGESFLDWADGRFDPSGDWLNHRISRKEIFDDVYGSSPELRKYLSSRNFMQRLMAYVEYMGYHFNPGKPHFERGESFEAWTAANPGKTFRGAADKSNGKEYITITTEGFARGTAGNPDPFGDADNPFENLD